MAEIIKTFREEVPAMRFIGKKYPDFGGWWGEWFANGWFDEIEKYFNVRVEEIKQAM